MVALICSDAIKLRAESGEVAIQIEVDAVPDREMYKEKLKYLLEQLLKAI